MSEPVAAEPELPLDSDVDIHVPAQQIELRAHPWIVLGVISLGGVLGSLARYGVALAMPAAPDGFPWATFAVNIVGSLLIGVLMELVTRVWVRQRYLRPFFGVGVLGGFTTFSTSIVDIQRLPVTLALVYAFGTLAAALLATSTAMAVTERLLRLGGRT